MASLGHIAVAMAAARVHRRGVAPRLPWVAILFWSALSLLPDADVVGFGLGVRYEDPWGHRGATHSIAFSLVLGLMIGIAGTAVRLPFVRTGLLASAVLVSHALLDTLTDGGLGCALLWPFDLTRYFAPWNPIAVAPIGLAFFSPFGMAVAAVELLQFSVLAVWALWPERLRGLWQRRRVVVLACAAGVLIMLSPLSGAVRETAVGAVLREDTEYASGYTDRGLNRISIGASDRQVGDALGEPLRIGWVYPSNQRDACFLVFIEDDRVVDVRDAQACQARGVEVGQAASAARAILGDANQTCWQYSRSPSGQYYRLRAVCFAEGAVTDIMRFWLRD